MSITLHHCHEARSMRTLWLLYELELDVHVELHSFGRELHDPEYLQHHPLGRVPCLIDGNTTLFESGAICEYLCETYDHRGLWRAPGAIERTQWLQWLHYAETVVVHGANLTQQAIAIVDLSLRSATVRKIETRRLEKSIALLEQHLQDKDYLFDGFSAVDIGIGYSLYVGRLFTDLSVFPRVQAYYNRLAQRPAFQRTLPSSHDPLRIYKQDNYWLSD